MSKLTEKELDDMVLEALEEPAPAMGRPDVLTKLMQIAKAKGAATEETE